ncbi:uncharacterized protein VNE69_06155 [Vairimorpha necatrix]|uniref:Uncharacterized protein n=1 Tax=Vairimorpha necatrix TaxID=6039 RepID=A0AAX4JCZ4_9MICR
MDTFPFYKNALYDSDDDIQNEQNLDFLLETYNNTMHKPVPHVQKKPKYSTLAKDEVELLEREFILRGLKFNKSNVKKLAKELKLPHKKSIEYFMNKMKNAGEKLRSDVYIKKIIEIKKDIKKTWEKYLDGCDKYGM